MNDHNQSVTDEEGTTAAGWILSVTFLGVFLYAAAAALLWPYVRPRVSVGLFLVAVVFPPLWPVLFFFLLVRAWWPTAAVVVVPVPPPRDTLPRRVYWYADARRGVL